MKSILLTALLLCTLNFTNGQVIDKSYFEDALTIILSFESNSLNIEDGYDKVTGNFDGNGVSLGLLQWNIGTGSLQRLVKKAGQETVLQNMPTYGDEFWKACNSKTDVGLQIVRSWQTNNVVNSGQLKELRSFLKSEKVRSLQYETAINTGKTAMNTAMKWAKDTRQSEKASFKEFVYFLDLYTFNSGLKWLWADDVFKYKKDVKNAQQEILNWLNTREKPLYSIKDAKANYKEWVVLTLNEEELNLFVLGYLRALISNGDSGKFKADVLNRRGTIAIGTGTVHESHYDFKTIYGRHQ